MNTDRFIAQVRENCPQLDVDVVHEQTLVTLDTLCEQLPKDQTKRMAAQLPDEIASAVTAGGDRGETTDVPIALADFYSKLMFRTELNETDVKALAQAVAQALEKALSDGEVEALALDLPSELDQLLSA